MYYLHWKFAKLQCAWYSYNIFVNDFRHYWQKSCLFLFVAKDCGPLSVPLNGSLTGNETTFPNEASFSCDDGFILNGSRTRRCQADGFWSGIQATCNGKIAVQMKTRALHFCQRILIFRTVYRLFPAVNCGPLPVPMNGSFSGDSTLFPNSVAFYCDPGFVISGSTKRTCQANGAWSGIVAACSGRFILNFSIDLPAQILAVHHTWYLFSSYGLCCLTSRNVTLLPQDTHLVVLFFFRHETVVLSLSQQTDLLLVIWQHFQTRSCLIVMRDSISGALMSGIVRQTGRGVEISRIAKVVDIPQFFFLFVV